MFYNHNALKYTLLLGCAGFALCFALPAQAAEEPLIPVSLKNNPQVGPTILQAPSHISEKISIKAVSSDEEENAQPYFVMAIAPDVKGFGIGGSIAAPLVVNATSACVSGASYESLQCGIGADASGLIGSTAIGSGAVASAFFNATAVGRNAIASGLTDSTALGAGAVASQNNATAIGSQAQATALGSIALGSGSFPTDAARSSGQGAIAIGGASQIDPITGLPADKGAEASGTGSVAMGTGSASNGLQSVAIGARSTATNNGATALGGGANASGPYATALGQNAQATGVDAIALGTGSDASGDGSEALGENAISSAADAIAIGHGANARFANSAAFGAGAFTTRDFQMSFGTINNTYTFAGITSAASLAAQGPVVGYLTTDAFGNLASDGGTLQDTLDNFGVRISTLEDDDHSGSGGGNDHDDDEDEDVGQDNGKDGHGDSPSNANTANDSKSETGTQNTSGNIVANPDTGSTSLGGKNGGSLSRSPGFTDNNIAPASGPDGNANVNVASMAQGVTVNAQDIATNTQNIAINFNRITANTDAIALNLSHIDLNAERIATNSGLILANFQSLQKQARGLAGVAALPDMFLSSGESLAISGGFGIVNDRVGFGTTIAHRISNRWSFGASAAVSGNQVTGKLQARWAR